MAEVTRPLISTCGALMLIGACGLLAGCLPTGRTVDTLPDAVEDRIAPVDTSAGVALRLLPTPDAERIEVDLGSISLPVNRLFAGMLEEMAQKKFGRIDPASGYGLEVAITYLNLEERAYMGATMLHRVEMAVVVKVRDGAREARREIVHAVEADLDGYAIRSDQLYELLVRFITSIDAFADQHVAGS